MPEAIPLAGLAAEQGAAVADRVGAVGAPPHASPFEALADDGLEIDEGTLYPLLRRLESQGLLVSQWREEDKRNKRFYRLSLMGSEILEQLMSEWERINASLSKILQEA